MSRSRARVLPQTEAVKVILIGAPRSGKTALFDRLKDSRFYPNYQKTIRANQFNLKETNLELNIWDLPSDESFVNAHHYMGAQIIIYVLNCQQDLDEQKAYCEAKQDLLSVHAPGALSLLVQTKNVGQNIDKEKVSAFIKKMNIEVGEELIRAPYENNGFLNLGMKGSLITAIRTFLEKKSAEEKSENHQQVRPLLPPVKVTVTGSEMAKAALLKDKQEQKEFNNSELEGAKEEDFFFLEDANHPSDPHRSRVVVYTFDSSESEADQQSNLASSIDLNSKLPDNTIRILVINQRDQASALSFWKRDFLRRTLNIAKEDCMTVSSAQKEREALNKLVLNQARAILFEDRFNQAIKQVNDKYEAIKLHQPSMAFHLLRFKLMLEKSKTRMLHDWKKGKISFEKADELVSNCQILASQVAKLTVTSQHIDTFHQKMKPYLTTSSRLGMILQALLGAALGVFLGAMAGAAAGPVAALTALYGGAKGAVLGASIGGTLGLASSGYSMWQRRNPYLDLEVGAAKIVSEKENEAAKLDRRAAAPRSS